MYLLYVCMCTLVVIWHDSVIKFRLMRRLRIVGGGESLGRIFLRSHSTVKEYYTGKKYNVVKTQENVDGERDVLPFQE